MSIICLSSLVETSLLNKNVQFNLSNAFERSRVAQCIFDPSLLYLIVGDADPFRVGGKVTVVA